MPVYRCTACGTRWSYAQVRHVACCKTCGCGLTRERRPPARAVDRDRRLDRADRRARGARGDE